MKSLVRLRDGDRCTECGMTGDEHVRQYGKALDVHRLIPGSVYTVDGCVTLCRACHGPKPKSPPAERGRLLTAYGRLVRIPAVWCVVLEELGAVEQNNLTDQVKIAVREYLERRDRLPKPPAKPGR